MKKLFVILTTIFALSFFTSAEMNVYIYKKDGTKLQYLANLVDSVGLLNLHIISFDANGGSGKMDMIEAKDGESIKIPSNLFTKPNSHFVAWNTKADGTGIEYQTDASEKFADNTTLYAQWEKINHEYVDLGLSVLWATCNIDANYPEEYGSYFAWGEVEPKIDYSSSTNKSPFYSNFRTEENDAAHVNWGGLWRMATSAEFKELYDNCKWLWTTENNISGYIITSKINGNSIFLPAAGYRSGKSLYEEANGAHYWSRSYHAECLIHDVSCYAIKMRFTSTKIEYRVAGDENLGYSIRPVHPYTNTVSFDTNGGVGIMDDFLVPVSKVGVLPSNNFEREGYYFKYWNTKADGSGISYCNESEISLSNDLVLYAIWGEGTNSNETNGHKWVDLGFSSGIKWATCNVGADTPEGYGDYFAWGETKPKNDYDWDTYTSSSYGSIDNKETIELVDDAANVNWGVNWRIPTIEEQNELRTKCTWEWDTVNGTKGYKVTGPNGNSIFLPASGYFSYTTLNRVGSSGCYWSSSLSSRDYASYLRFYSEEVEYSSEYRCYGMTIRPVFID